MRLTISWVQVVNIEGMSQELFDMLSGWATTEDGQLCTTVDQIRSAFEDDEQFQQMFDAGNKEVESLMGLILASDTYGLEADVFISKPTT